MKNFNELFEKLYEAILAVGYDLIIIIVIIAIGKLLLNVVSHFTYKAMKNTDKLEDKEKSQEIKTNITVAHSANRYLVCLIIIFLCLKQIGLGDQVSNALVAAGIGGLIISLGAQTIVKDMVAGIFINFERQYLVGDYVKINDHEGTVTSIALRVTYLNCKGKKVIIPNGEIRDVINYSKLNAKEMFTVPVSYKEKTDKVINIINDVINAYYKKNKDVLISKPEVLGITDFKEKYLEIGILIETKPLKQFNAVRQLRLLIKEEFDKNKISFPYKNIIENKK